MDDDWDQEASLAAFVAEVEAARAHGLVDLDDLYYGEPWDSEVDLRGLDAPAGEAPAGAESGPPLPESGPPLPEAGPPLPELDPPLPELDAGFLPRGRPGVSSGAGRPSSSRTGAGHRSGFASEGVWDTALPGPALAESADAAARAGRGYAGASDDELIGVLGAWARIESWAAAGRLSAVAELIRRRPATRGERASRGGIPVSWGKFCADELAVALSISRWAAEKMTGLAQDLATRLPLTNRALAEGVIDAYKAQVVAEATRLLDDSAAAEVEASLVPDGVVGKNPGQIRVLVARAVLKADPGAARQRREQAQRDARVELWREDAGTAAICGFGLPPDEALAADARITTRAMELKAVGVPGTTDQLRVRAYLDALLGQDTSTRYQPTANTPSNENAPGSAHVPGSAHAPDGGHVPGSGHAPDGGHVPGSGHAPDGDRTPGGERSPGRGGTRAADAGPQDCGPQDCAAPGGSGAPDGSGAPQTGDGPCGDGRAPGNGGSPGNGRAPAEGPAPDGESPHDGNSATAADGQAASPDGRHPAHGQASRHGQADADSHVNHPAGARQPAARINLTIPLATLLGLAEHPGEAAGFGPIDPALARTLAAQAAGNPRTTWCVTVTDSGGHPVAHGCAQPRKSKRRRHREAGSPGPSSEPPGPRPQPPGGPPPTTGPSGTYGTWRLQLPTLSETGPPDASGPLGPPGLTVDLEPLAVTSCDHRHHTAAHDPSPRLRHLVEVRDGECDYPPCRRAAARSDFEHTIAWEEGGLTCACNAGPRCRHHHHAKQALGWRVEQHEPGYHTWTTPSGRQYTTGPTTYPI